MNPSQQQQQQQQQFGPPRRTTTYGQQQHDELHLPSSSQQQQQQVPLSPRDYSKMDHQHQQQQQQQQQAPPQYHQSGVPGVLQPGRPGVMGANTAPALPTMGSSSSQQQQDMYAAASKPPSLSLSSHHSYSRSSPAAGGYEAGGGPSSSASSAVYVSYTPTTPGGGGGQYMSPSSTEPPGGGMGKYGAPGSQRNISNTPLGLADIRPRTDSSLSDGIPGTLAYELANAQPGPSNYLAPWALYAFDWCKWPAQGNGAGKVAVGSYLEDGHNFIQILDTQVVPTPPESLAPGSSRYTMDFTKVAEATHSYPVTRLLWEPPSSQKQTTDLLATSGDHLRLWSLPADAATASQGAGAGRDGNSITRRVGGSEVGGPVTKLTPLALLSNSKTPDHTAPLTSLDWNTVSPSLIITSSIDTTCTIWDIPSLTAKTQLIAHDKEVYDVRFCAGSIDVFVSCGQDGSVRMFDLRSLEHSTIIYEPTAKDERDASGGRMSPTLAQQTMSHPPPLLRLATSPHDTHLLATFAMDSSVVRILDVRQPGQALLELRGHGGAVNCIEWNPLRRGILASGGDDCQVLVWDLMSSAAGAVGGLPPPQPPQPQPPQQQNGNAAGGAAAGAAAPPAQAPQAEANGRGPIMSWRCDYEVGNLGWTPRLGGQGEYGEWLGVSAGRGVWGVKFP